MRRLRLTLPLLIAFAWFTPPSASAQIACDGRYVCVYEHSNQTGCRFAAVGIAGDLRNERWADCPDQDLNDKISSFSNTTASQYNILYEHPGAKGAKFCIRPGQTGNIPKSLNDKASSIVVYDYPNGAPKEC